MAGTVETLRELEKKILWLASWTIHNANHLRENSDGLKVGGHQASSASLATIMTALYLDVLKPADRVAVKPHASPIFHAIQYLLGKQTRERLENFRGYKGAQSYPSRTKDLDDVDFSTGSVGLGVAQTLFSSLVQDYVRAHGWGTDRPEGRMVALVGDAELDEGNIFEARARRLEAGPAQLLVDHRLQPAEPRRRRARGPVGALRAAVQEFRLGRGDPEIRLAAAGGVQGAGRRAAEGMDRQLPELALLGAWCSPAAPPGASGSTTRSATRATSSRLIEKRSDDELAALMNNLGGHDLPSVLDAFHKADSDRPTCFIAYTVKGFGLPFAGHKDNHAGLMTPAQMETFRKANKVRPGHEWDKFEGLRDAAAAPAEIPRRACRSRARRRSSAEAPRIDVPDELTGHASSRRCRRRPASARFSTRSAAATASSPAASSRPRPTSPSPPISGPG